MRHNSNNIDSTKWTELLAEAVSKPGVISKAYRSFYGYSIGNQMIALLQCQMRKLEPGPISTYPGWKAKGRQVKRGEKAIVLCMPVTGKRKAEDKGEEDAVFVRFIYKANWFVLLLRRKVSQSRYRPFPIGIDRRRSARLPSAKSLSSTWTATVWGMPGSGRSPSIHSTRCRIRPPSTSVRTPPRSLFRGRDERHGVHAEELARG